MTTTPDVTTVNCPSCGVLSGIRCRTLTTGRPTAPHSARYVLYAELRAHSRAEHPSNRRHLRLIR